QCGPARHAVGRRPRRPTAHLAAGVYDAVPAAQRLAGPADGVDGLRDLIAVIKAASMPSRRFIQQRIGPHYRRHRPTPPPSGRADPKSQLGIDGVEVVKNNGSTPVFRVVRRSQPPAPPPVFSFAVNAIVRVPTTRAEPLSLHGCLASGTANVSYLFPRPSRSYL